MGKVKIEIYCSLIADILTKRSAEMFVEWSSTKHIILDQTSQFDAKFVKKYLKKINSSEAIRGIKPFAELFIMLASIKCLLIAVA